MFELVDQVVCCDSMQLWMLLQLVWCMTFLPFKWGGLYLILCHERCAHILFWKWLHGVLCSMLISPGSIHQSRNKFLTTLHVGPTWMHANHRGELGWEIGEQELFQNDGINSPSPCKSVMIPSLSILLILSLILPQALMEVDEKEM